MIIEELYMKKEDLPIKELDESIAQWQEQEDNLSSEEKAIRNAKVSKIIVDLLDKKKDIK